MHDLVLREKYINAEIDTIYMLLKSNDESNISKVLIKSQSVGLSSIFNPNTGTYDESISSGKLNTILNDSLRSEIFNYYRLVKSNKNDHITDGYQTNIIVPEFLNILIPTKQGVKLVTNIDHPNLNSLTIKTLFDNPQFNKVLLWRKVNTGMLIDNWSVFQTNSFELRKHILEELDK